MLPTSPDLLLMAAPDFSGWSSDPNRPDYASPAYREQTVRWQLVHDARGSTENMRRRAATYLPRFEAETLADWYARVAMTFANDYYATTIPEHVGLVFSRPLKLGDDVPDAIEALCEDIDGEGNHIDVFAETTLDAALHLGHCVLFTDYPIVEGDEQLSFTPPPGYSQSVTVAQAKAAKVRPYVTLYKASDVLSAKTVTVGGVLTIVQISFRETSTEEDGIFGVKECVRYRVITQEVFYDGFTGRASGLGAITWRTWQKNPALTTGGAETFGLVGEGTITGPDQIPARVVYGGEKLGVLHTKPHLYGLALSNIEETQVKSDYRNNMHKCNVLTPVFKGRQTSTPGGDTIQMGQGIDVPADGDAFFLEPTGAALNSTRQHLEDIRAQMRRQGATIGDEFGKTKTATEAAIYAKQKNAKLTKAARSLQDALEGVLADFAAFMGLAKPGMVKSGGSVAINQKFSGVTIDPALLTVALQFFEQDGLTLQELRYLFLTGQPPEDFDPADTSLLEAAAAARQDQMAIEAAAADAANKAANGVPAGQSELRLS